MIRFGDRRRKVAESKRVAFTVPLDPSTKVVDWEAAKATELMPEALLKDAPVAASYLPLPAGAMELKVFTRWAKNFDRWLARTQRLEIAPKAMRPNRRPSAPSGAACQWSWWLLSGVLGEAGAGAGGVAAGVGPGGTTPGTAGRAGAGGPNIALISSALGVTSIMAGTPRSRSGAAGACGMRIRAPIAPSRTRSTRIRASTRR